MLTGVYYKTRGNYNMDHDTVVREQMTEKYLLAELTPKLRNEFEEHFFDCPECASDLRAGAEFVAHTKVVLKEFSEPVFVPKPVPPAPPDRGWFSWLRPAFAVPAMAVLLIVIGYQNLVTLPQLSKAVQRAQILPGATLNIETYDSNSVPLPIHLGQAFVLNVIVPPGQHYTAYRVDLRNPSGTIEASQPVAESTDGIYEALFPGVDRKSGIYRVTMNGVTDSGQEVEIGRSSVELKVQK